MNQYGNFVIRQVVQSGFNDDVVDTFQFHGDSLCLTVNRPSDRDYFFGQHKNVAIRVNMFYSLKLIVLIMSDRD